MATEITELNLFTGAIHKYDINLMTCLWSYHGHK